MSKQEVVARQKAAALTVQASQQEAEEWIDRFYVDRRGFDRHDMALAFLAGKAAGLGAAKAFMSGEDE